MPSKLRLQLFNVETPRANQDYELAIAGTVKRGKADGKGIVELWVPPDARQGTLPIGPDRAVIELQIGHLDPSTEVAGLQTRLSNLGYSCQGDPPGEIHEATRQALRSFQRRFRLQESGDFDGPTRALLTSFHDRHDLFPDDPWLVKA